MVTFSSTNCCALAQLNFDSGDTLESLNYALSVANYNRKHNSGAPSIFAICTPSEKKKMEPYLKKLGFKKQFLLERSLRHKGAGRKLSFWLLKLSTFKGGMSNGGIF